MRDLVVIGSSNLSGSKDELTILSGELLDGQARFVFSVSCSIERGLDLSFNLA
jgi:hypothetical protein